MATPPTYVTRYQIPMSGSTTPRTVSVTVAVGDVLYAAALSGTTTRTVSAPTGGTSMTWTPVKSSVGVSSRGNVYLWRCDVTVAQTYTLSVASPSGGTGGTWGVEIIRVSGHGGEGASVVGTGSGAPSLNITTTGANSMVFVAWSDESETSIATRAYRTNAGTATEMVATNSSNFAGYVIRHNDSSATGTKALGATAPTGQTWAMVAVEILGAGPASISGAASAPLGGLTATATGTAWRYVDALTDNFDDNSINSTKWPATFGTGTIAETGAKMTVAPPVDGTLTGIFSAATYRFAGRTVAAQIVPAALNGSAWAWAGITCYHQDYNSYARVYVQRDAGTPETFTMGLVLKDAGTVTRNTFVTSALADMAWIRLRESGGTTYAEASPTGEPNSWVTADSFTTPAILLTSTQIEIDLEAQRATGASSAAGPATWDNFNLAPTFTSITGSAAAALGGLTASATGTRLLSAPAAANFGGLAATAVAATTHPASATAPLGGLVATASGAVQHPATASGGLGGLTASASGVRSSSATAAANLGGLAATADAALVHGGAASGGLGALVVTASAGVAVGATAAANLGALTAVAEGTATPGGDVNYATNSVYQGPTEVTVDLIAGQLLLLHNAWDWGSHTGMVAPTGGAVSWTEVTADTNTSNAPMHRVWTGVAAADGEVAITCAASTADSWNHLHLRWYPPGWVVVDAASAVGSGTADVEAPSLADGETADVLVASALKGYQGGGIDFEPPGSMVAIETDPTGEYSTLATATETLTGDGATGVRDFTAPFSLVEWTSSSVLLREGGAEPVVGAASAPLGALTASADATRQAAGSAAAVLGGLSATAAGGIDHPATTAAALGGLTAAATAMTAHPASASAPLGALAATAAVAVAVGASASATLGSLSATATATVGHPASAAAALGALTATGSAGVTVPASAAAQLGGLTATAAAQTSVGATATAPLGGLAANAAGQPTHPGSASALLGVLTATAAAGHAATATATATLGPLAAAADGVATGEGSGSASAPLGALTATAAASRSTTGSAQAPLGALTATATGRHDVTATAAASLGGLTATAVGAGGGLASAHATLGSLAATASATRSLPGTAVANLGQLAAAANAEAGTIAAAYADLYGLTATAAAAVAVHAAAAAPLGGLDAGADATNVNTGSAIATLGGLAGAALAIRIVIGAAHADLGPLTATAVAGPTYTWTPPLHAGAPIRTRPRLHAGAPQRNTDRLHAGTPTRD